MYYLVKIAWKYHAPFDSYHATWLFEKKKKENTKQPHRWMYKLIRKGTYIRVEQKPDAKERIICFQINGWKYVAFVRRPTGPTRPHLFFFFTSLQINGGSIETCYFTTLLVGRWPRCWKSRAPVCTIKKRSRDRTRAVTRFLEGFKCTTTSWNCCVTGHFHWIRAEFESAELNLSSAHKNMSWVKVKFVKYFKLKNLV
jgi:hypothetical protein